LGHASGGGQQENNERNELSHRDTPKRGLPAETRNLAQKPAGVNMVLRALAVDNILAAAQALSDQAQGLNRRSGFDDFDRASESTDADGSFLGQLHVILKIGSVLDHGD
jgi:hypothetical protein